MSCSSWIRTRNITGFLFSRLSWPLRFRSSSSSALSSSSSRNGDGYSSFFPTSCNKESSVYHNALKCQRPATIYQLQIPHRNSVTFIGSLVFPVKRYSSYNGVWTVLEVKSPGKSKPTFRICLEMRDEMAEISLQHLVENDVIYVSGPLVNYTKVDSNGGHVLHFKVIVKELNFVKQNNRCQTFQKPESLKPNSVPVSILGALDKSGDKDKECLHLWQVFFASPYEWWDNRQHKRHQRAPDFKHKDTGECLWIMPNDPPWVTKQLRLLDSETKERGQRGLVSTRSHLSIWEYDDL